mgnify:CR=1 FL=1
MQLEAGSDIKIPFLDLEKQYQSIKPEIDGAIQKILDTASFVKGKTVLDFEQAFAEYVGAKYCIGVGNGTDALTIALRAVGIGMGDEVITVPNTFIATIEAIASVGATPVLVDINFDNYTINPDDIVEAITERTKAIMPVHLYGMPCDMEPIINIAEKYKLKIICDGAQAHGARYNGSPLGMYGEATTYSFYPGKNLGAYGDGGAIVTNNKDLACTSRMLADHGRVDKYVHQFYGYNSRLDAIQAAILNVKLKYLDNWNQRRKEIAKIYSKELSGIKYINCPIVPDYADPIWHLYVIQAFNRDELQAHLKSHNIQTGIHYPVPVSEQPAAHGVRVMCNRTKINDMAQKLLSLPMCPEMTDEMVYYVTNRIKQFYKKEKED